MLVRDFVEVFTFWSHFVFEFDTAALEDSGMKQTLSIANYHNSRVTTFRRQMNILSH